MNLYLGKVSHKVIGGKGKLGYCLQLELRKHFENESIRVLHSESLVDLLLTDKSERFRTNIIYWCAGFAKPASTKEVCEKDLEALKLFLSGCSYFKQPCYLVFLSSGGTVYGNSPGEVNEMSPLNPQSFYAEMKIASEKLIQEATNRGILRAIVLRLANVYGHTSLRNPSGLVDSALHFGQLKISSKLESRKQYGLNCDYSKNLVNLLDRFTDQSLYLETRNLFPPQTLSIVEIIRIVRAYSNQKLEIELLSSEKSLPLQSVVLSNHLSIKLYPEYWSSLVDYINDYDSRADR